MDWLKNLLADLWLQTKAFLTDLPVVLFESLLNAISSLISSIPKPDFLTSGIGALFGNLDNSIVYFLVQAGFFQGLVVYGAGVSFRVLRKVLTLGQW